MNAQDPREYWNQQASIYALGVGHRRLRRFLALYEEACWRTIEPHLPGVEGSLILEAACGTGRWAMRLAPLGHRVVLSDLSPEMVARACEKLARLGLSDRVAGTYVLGHQEVDLVGQT